MAEQLDRVVRISVRDPRNRRVPGATVTFLVNGTPFAEIPQTRDEDPSFQIRDESVVIGVVVKYGDFRDEVTLRQDQNSWDCEIPLHLIETDLNILILQTCMLVNVYTQISCLVCVVAF